MGSRKVRTSLSKDNKYYISKERRLELIHFCLQYPEWKRYLENVRLLKETDEWDDPTGEEAIKRYYASKSIELVEECCSLAGADIYEYLLRSVAYGESYVLLSTKYDIPCGKNYFYDRYHKFWFILSQKKHALL